MHPSITLSGPALTEIQGLCDHAPGTMDEPFSDEIVEGNRPAPPATFKPSAWYFRRALRNAISREDAIEIGLQAVLEIETLKEFIRQHGLLPPKVYILSSEAEEKGFETASM